MRCLFDHNRTCDEGVHENPNPRCRMWDTNLKECLIVVLVQRQVLKAGTVTVAFPPSAPPPEVR